MQIIRLLHQRRRDSGIDLRGGEPLVPHLLLNHGHGNAGHERIDHMAMPTKIKNMVTHELEDAGIVFIKLCCGVVSGFCLEKREKDSCRLHSLYTLRLGCLSQLYEGLFSNSSDIFVFVI